MQVDVEAVHEVPGLIFTELSDMATTTRGEKKIGLSTVLLIIALVVGFPWAAHLEFSRVYDRIGQVDRHISRVETAVRIIAAKQGGDTKALIDEALTAADRKSVV